MMFKSQNNQTSLSMNMKHSAIRVYEQVSWDIKSSAQSVADTWWVLNKQRPLFIVIQVGKVD